MSGISTQMKTLKATTVAYAFLAAILLIAIFPLVVKAEEVASPPTATIQAPAELEGGVESPGIPNITSELNNYEIIWVWTAPNGGLTPNANPDEPGDQPTDIIYFGYELLRDGVSGGINQVESGPLSLTTTVDANGQYTLKIWSITREGLTSVAVSGSVDIAKTIDEPLPPIDDGIIPDPIDTSGVIDKQATSENTISRTAPINANGQVVTNSLGFGDAHVLSATDDENTTTPIDTAAVVKPSSQGWVILGMAWYVWVLIIAAVFTAGRGIMVYIKAH